MRVLHVNTTDLPSRRFGGFDLLSDMRSYGIDGSQAVLIKSSAESRVVPLWADRVDEDTHAAIARVEKRRSMDNLLFPWARRLARLSAFQEADVIHYHLIHGGTLSLLDMPWLTSLKPSVWTFHDAWPLTGHCVQPGTCEKWLSGCVGCPDLNATFPLVHDNANRMWQIKHDVINRMDIDVVVPSAYMEDLVRRSPNTSHLGNEGRLHLIPFGIDLQNVPSGEQRLASRRALGISATDFVILFRSTDSGLKGQEYITSALAMRTPARPTTLLTVDRIGLLGDLRAQYSLSEQGWVDDADRYRHVLAACDVLLMPSPAESFGMMALEAMAAGRPVICFEGTAVAWLTRAPECGIAVPLADVAALRKALDHLADEPGDAVRRGALGREIAAEHHSHGTYLAQLKSLYETVIARATE